MWTDDGASVLNYRGQVIYQAQQAAQRVDLDLRRPAGNLMPGRG